MCPETENLIRNTELRSEDDNIDNMTYRQWMTSDISATETTVQSCSDFKSTFLKSWIPYYHLSQHYSNYVPIINLSWNLKPETIFINN
jgi:hypothetical protein